MYKTLETFNKSQGNEFKTFLRMYEGEYHFVEYFPLLCFCSTNDKVYKTEFNKLLKLNNI